MSQPRRASVALSWLALAGCRGDPTPAARIEPAPPPPSVAIVASAHAFTSASASPPAPPREAPKAVALEAFHPAKSEPERVFSIEGALIVTDHEHVGRVTGDSIQWIGDVPKERFPKNTVQYVRGKYPDRIDVAFDHENDRAADTTYFPLTGPGGTHHTSPGASTGRIAGYADVGDSLLLLTSYLNSESSFVTVRGPRVKRLAILSATACSPKDERSGLPAEAALVPESFGGTPAGTLIAFGGHCRRGGLGAEVWDPNGHSGIVDVVDMAALGSGYNWPLGVFPGHGDELWAAFAGAPLIHYRDGRFESIPTPGGLLAATAQPGGPLYAATATAIHRLDDGAWAKLAEWPWPAAILTLAEENGVFWVSVGQRFKDSSVYRLAPAAPFALTDECRAPFVHLYDVSEKNGPTFTYPTTRKALASFDKASDLGLVEFIEAGVKRLGVTAKTKAAAEALVAHLATAMPKEHPRPLCYVPQSPRAIDLAGGK